MLLMEEAERIAREEHGSDKMVVISGVGTRNYYAKIGYKLDGPYMAKSLIWIYVIANVNKDLNVTCYFIREHNSIIPVWFAVALEA